MTGDAWHSTLESARIALTGDGGGDYFVPHIGTLFCL